MADLIQIQYEVVDKGKSLKTALTGVERMEKSLAKLSKEIVSGTVTQDRQRKALIAYGRELKRLTGLTGTQAYGAVVKYKNALVNQTVAQNKAAVASQRLAKVQDYLASRQERVTLAAQKQNAALHQTKNRMNGSNMAIQQMGYQFGDFAVQVQGGTSAFVAFSQQASQLVGILPMIAGPLGLTVGAAVGLSAALGILIPIGSAVARMFFDMKGGVDKSEDSLDKLTSALSDYQSAAKLGLMSTEELRDEFGSLGDQMKRLAGFFQSVAVSRALETLTTDTSLFNQELSDAAALIKSLEGQIANIAPTEAEIKFFSAEEILRANEAIGVLQDKIDSTGESLKLLPSQINILNDALSAVNKSQSIEEIRDTSLAALKVIEGMNFEFGKVPPEITKIVANLEDVVGTSARATAEAVNMKVAYDDVLGSVEGIAAAEAARLALTQVGDSGYAGGRGGDPRDFTNLDEFRRQLKDVTKETKNLKKGMTDAERAAEKLRKELERPMVNAIESVSNAFGDFIADGLRDFKSFASSIVNSFKSMIAQMIATAARNKIMLSLGMGGSGFAAQAAAGQVAGVGGNSFGGPLGSMIGSFGAGGGFGGGTGLLGGIGGIASGMSGIFSGGGLSASFANLGGLMSGSVGGMGAIGAALPALGAVAVVIGLLSKKTKLLDSGLRTTVEGFDVAIETFKKTQSSRLFGLLKGSKVTSYEAASAEVADPLIEAIGNMQQSIVEAAGTLGIGANAFDDFSYQFKLSLKGLTEEEQLQKINEEITKMGDSFASLTGHFETMNELLEAANQRMQLQNRLDQLLGNNQAILTRQREAELKAMHELNRPLAQAIYDLEDANAAVANSFAALRASIDLEKTRVQDSFASLLDGLKERLDVVNETMQQSRNIYDMLANAVSGRSVTSGISQTFARREGALSFIRGGDFSDENKLREALDVVAEPTEDLFGSFVDYARDFARTSITLEEAKKVAQVQLTADEQSVLLLEEQITQAQTDLEQQLDALDQQYQMMVDQYNALLGIDTSVKSVGEAIGTLRGAIEALASAQAAAKAAAAVGTGGSAGAGSGAAAAGIQMTGEKYKGFDLGKIKSAADLMAAAAQNDIKTSGQTGAQIQQALSNATGLAINMGNDIRAKQFAMGGYHTGGLRMVGERGPELEATGPSRIFSHNQTSGMFRDPDLKDAVRSLKEEVSGLRSEQRQIQMGISKYIKRGYDIERKWDVDGLPATRT